MCFNLLRGKLEYFHDKQVTKTTCHQKLTKELLIYFKSKNQITTLVNDK